MWVNGLDEIKKIKGWKSLEAFAAEKRWVGARKLPPAPAPEPEPEPPKKKQRLTTDPIDPKQQQQGDPIDPKQQQPTDPIDPICKYRDHNWENCDKPDYAKNGVLKSRNCRKCKGKFMDRKKRMDESETNNCFVTRKEAAQYCTRCKVSFCHPCFGIYVVESVAEPRTPRKGD